jgi:hypothetical protein
MTGRAHEPGPERRTIEGRAVDALHVGPALIRRRGGRRHHTQGLSRLWVGAGRTGAQMEAPVLERVVCAVSPVR